MLDTRGQRALLEHSPKKSYYFNLLCWNIHVDTCMMVIMALVIQGKGWVREFWASFICMTLLRRLQSLGLNLAIIAKLTLEFAVFCSVGVFMKSMSQDCNPARI